jgi:hypothetical protein
MSQRHAPHPYTGRGWLPRFECGRQHLAVLCLLLLPAFADAQIVLGGPRPSKDDIARAKSVLAAAEETPITWNIGEFDLLVRGETAKGDVQFDSTDESILTLEEIPAGVVFWFEGVRAGQPNKTLHKFKAEKESYWVARAAREGKCTIKVWANGDSGKPPRIIARLDVQVGKPAPPIPPPPPPDDAFTKSLRDALAKDVAAGKGNNAHVALLAQLFRVASSDIPDTTASGLLTKLKNAAASLGLPGPAQSLTALRNAIADELDKRLPTEERQLTLEDKNRITATFNTLADVLEVLAK